MCVRSRRAGMSWRLQAPLQAPNIRLPIASPSGADVGGTIATQRLGKHRVNSVAKILAWPLLLLALAYVLACGFLYAAQASFLYHPTAARPGDAASRFLLHRDGIDLVVSSRDRDGPQAVLYFGGNAEDVTDSLPELASTFPDSAIYALHYRGYGGSGGPDRTRSRRRRACAVRRHPQDASSGDRHRSQPR